MATVKRTVFNERLIEPYSVTVECGGKEIEFRWEERAKVGEWIDQIWKEQEDEFFYIYSPAYVFYNIDWDSDHVLYAKYERVG